MSASEELSFTLDSDACLSAQNDLINLGKRLTSEIGWFPDLDKDSVIQIQERIDANEELATDGLTQISTQLSTILPFLKKPIYTKLVMQFLTLMNSILRLTLLR